MKRLIIAIVSVLAAGFVVACVITRPLSHHEPQTLEDEGALYSQAPEETPEEPGPSRAEQITKTLAAAYPQIIERAEFRSTPQGNDDWALLIRGTWYYYAEGRLLPEQLLENAAQYSSVGFMSNYQKELPPWVEPTPEQAERNRNRGTTTPNNNSANTNTPRPRPYPFLEDLLQTQNREQASQQQKSVRLFGKAITVHSDIVELLALVEQRITEAAKTDPALQLWINNIGEVHGWNWRNVAGSSSISRHSYGIAIDILPKSLGGKQTYWQWAAQSGLEWWNVPYEDRYHPPDAVVKAFEAYGFIWGGKWQIYDTMHFEYRPETFILSGLELTMLAD